MVTVNEKENLYVLDLNETEKNHFELNVKSTKNDFPCHWWIDFTSSNDTFNAKANGDNSLILNVNRDDIKKNELIFIKNAYKESVKVMIKPSLESLRVKNYIFKLGKYHIDGNEITFEIISSENGKNIPWDVIYDGKPLEYEIKKSTANISIKLMSILFGETKGVIELSQDKSNNKIKIILSHKDSNTVEYNEQPSE